MNKRNTGQLIFLIASIIFIFTCIYTMQQMTYTDNEPIYIMAGYYYVSQGDVFYTGHPILTHIIAGVPLLFLDVDAPAPEDIDHPFEFARQEFLYYGDNDPEEIVFWSRLPFIFLSLLFAWYLFKWTKELYGLIPGTAALILYTFNPDIIWNSVVVMTDLAVAGFSFISFYYLWKYFKREQTKFLVWAGIFFGLALNSKSTALFIIPVYLSMFILYRWKAIRANIYDLTKFALLALLVFSLINIADYGPIYDADNAFYLQSEGSRTDERLEEIVQGFTSNTFIQDSIIFSLKDLTLPGAASFQAYASQILHSVDGHTQYWLGEYNQHGVWYYYIAAYAIKTPIALLLFFIFAGLSLWKLRAKWKDEWTLLLPIAIVLFISSLIVRLNLGLRHTLIILFCAIIFSAKVFQFKKWKKKVISIILILLLIWYIGASLWIMPSYVSYFNEAIGGPINGPKYILDASIDIGQDLGNVKIYMDENNIDTIKLRYAGFANITEEGIDYEWLDCEPTTGTLAVSVNSLYGRFWYENIKPDADLTCYSWLRELEPVDTVGYSIYIYDITEEDLEGIGYV
jgi:hypothetical protein